MKKRSRMCLLAAQFSLMFLLNGCGNQEVITTQTNRTEISFSWWGNDQRHDYTIPAIKEFEKLHPEIKVKCHYAEWAGYQTRNKVQMVSNTESDVMQINYSWLSQYSPDGNGYYDINLLTDTVDLSTYTEEDLAYGMQNGKLNAVPIALNTETIFINKTIYEQFGLDIPRTWDDLYKAADVMNGEHYPLPMSRKPAFFLLVSYTGEITGKDFMDNDGKILYNKDDIRLMIESYQKLVEKKVTPNVEHFDKLNLGTGVYAGSMAWVSDSISYCSSAIENGYEMVVGDYITAKGNLDNWYAKPATMYAISKNTEHPDEAALLLDYLVNSTEMAEYQKIEKGIPLSKAARNYLTETGQLDGIQFDAFNMMSDNKDKLEIISPYFENDDLMKAFFSACNEVIYNKSTVEEQTDIIYELFAAYSLTNSKTAHK